jgi:hypothetical protein
VNARSDRAGLKIKQQARGKNIRQESGSEV